MTFDRPRRSNPFVPLIGGVLALATLSGLGYFTYRSVFQAPPNIESMTVPVKEENLKLRIKASGTVLPFQSVNVSPTQAGRLKRLFVDRGMQVKAGQPLAEMENDELRAQGIQAQASLKQAIANLREAEIRLPQEIQQAQARVSAEEARLKEAQARIPTQIRRANGQIVSAQERFQRARGRYQRYQLPAEAGAVSDNALDDAAVDLRTAEVNLFDAQQNQEKELKTARPTIDQIGASIVETRSALAEKQKNAQIEIARLQAAAEQAQARLKEIEVQFRQTLITAPFDGIITQRYAIPGAFVTPTTSASATSSATSTSIVAIAQGLEVVAKVPEVDITQVTPGQRVEVLADAFPDRVVRGIVRLVSPEAVVEQNVTSFEVRILLEPGNPLRSGMNVDNTFIGKDLPKALVIPTVAIVTKDGETGVWVLGKEDKPEFKSVTLGASIDDKTQVLSGLVAGDKVFTDLPKELRPKEDQEE